MTEQASLQVQQTNTDQVSNWIKEGWETFKAFPGMFVLFIIIEFIILMAASYVPFLGTLASFVMGPLFYAGWLLAIKKKEAGSEIEVGDLFLGFKKDYFAPVLILAVILTLILIGLMSPLIIIGVLVGVTAMITEMSSNLNYVIGLFLFVSFGLLVYCVYIMCAMFSTQLVVLNKVDSMTAIKLSFKACIENIWPLTIYGLITIGLSLLCLLTAGLGFLVLYPVLKICSYVMYKDIFKNASAS